MTPTLARFAPAKINLFLEVNGRRADGYHDIVTVMESIGIGDTVEVSAAASLVVEANRPDVPSGEANLAFKIVRSAEVTLGRALPAHIHITKRLPPGSGLGAGSSDAVAALRLVLDLHQVDADRETLFAIAAAVGSDTAFFVDGAAAICTGRGEIVRPIAARGVRHVAVVLPTAPCGTAAVYRALADLPPRGAPRAPDAVIAALLRGSSLASDADLLLPFNGLDDAAVIACPDLGARREHLTALAGRRPLLSGSGGSFFFLCPSQGEAHRLSARLRELDPSLDVRETASYR
jgi:4-diphosphocytidyl-2-C-methyl-D-erythritol kinase